MNKNQNITVSLVKVEDGLAYEVTIHSEAATLWQYIETLDNFLDEKVAPCLGCDNCCYQRIPLTLPDIYGYAGKEKEAIGRFLDRSTVIQKEGFALDLSCAKEKTASALF